MNNIYLLIIEMFICLIALITIYIKYKVDGLYGYVIVTFIVSNIMSLKIISLYNFDVNLGIIPFTTTFVASNIIIQKHGIEEIRKLTLTIVGISIVTLAILYLTSLLSSSNILLFTSKSYDNILAGSERIYFANIVTILYSLLANSKLYYQLKTERNKIWISNIFSGIIIQFIVTILFNVLAYALLKEWINIIQMATMRYLISIIVIISSTIDIYIANHIKEK